MQAVPEIPYPQSGPLSILLDASLGLPPEYQNQLTSHLPMALQALHRLGATPQRLQEYYDFYIPRFAGVETAPHLQTSVDWKSLRGRVDAYPTLVAAFAAMVERDGAEQVLRESLPVLLPGVAAAAFHGVIRTAHAVESGHRGEIAAALAYWAWRWQSLAAPVTLHKTLKIDAWADSLVHHAQGWKTHGELISIRIEQATHSSIYQTLAVGPSLDADVPQTIARLASLAIKLYTASPNFTVLHMVTGLRALRALLPWADSCQEVQPVLFRAFTAAYLAAWVAPPRAPLVAEERNWQQLIDAACASNDDHVIKMVHTCMEEARVYGPGNYLQAARLVVR
jgi:hypothetical protein